MNKAFWKDKRVFLTGHTGFKGSWLALWLERLGAQVTGFSLPPPTSPSLSEDASIDEGIHSIIGDIRDVDALRSAVQSCDPEIAFHLAAQPLVRFGYAEPLLTYSTNVQGTVHFLEVLRECNALKSIVVVTSDKCYEENEARRARGYKEGDPLGGPDPYSSSKACAEEVVAAYRAAYYLNSTEAPGLATARAGNVIGGGDWADDRLIPDLIRGFITDKPIAIRLPNAKRPWQHVLDPLLGYLILAERLWNQPEQYSEPWNFGPNEDHHQTVGWIANETVRNWGGAAGWHHEESPHLPEADVLRLDSSKALRLLEWQPVLSLKDALSWIVEWHRSHQAGEDMRKRTLYDIQRFEALQEKK